MEGDSVQPSPNYFGLSFDLQPYFLGPYLGATVAALFWMSVNYVRYNYDKNYTQQQQQQPSNDNDHRQRK